MDKQNVDYLILDAIQKMIDPISDLSKLLFDVARNDVRWGICATDDVFTGNHLPVDEKRQFQKPGVGNRARQVRAVEQRNL